MSEEIVTKKEDSEVIDKKEITPPKVFKCEICKLHSNYNYYGTKPLERHQETNVQSSSSKSSSSRKEDITLLEKCFVCDDPFLENKSRNYLILGSRCNRCQKMICVSSKCSLFYYTKRFCINCAAEYVDEFPNEIKTELVKIINSSKAE